MNLPNELKYTESHEWIRVEGDIAVIGITDHAQSELGDIVYVELPEAGKAMKADDSFGTIESVKTVSELYAPVSGTVTEINESLGNNAELVNTDPYGAGWLIKLKFENEGDIEKLLTAEGYMALIEEN